MGKSTQNKRSTFISYSSADHDLVKPIAQMLRAFNDHVFLDRDSLIPSQKWEPQLYKSIAKADMVVVFWCGHSKSSEWVQKEFEYALRKRKKILPIILDDTPLIDVLSAYQAVDCRIMGGASHEPLKPKPAEKPITKIDQSEAEDLKVTYRDLLKNPHSPNEEFLRGNLKTTEEIVKEMREATQKQKGHMEAIPSELASKIVSAIRFHISNLM